ncbi:MAG: hypothetical protein ACI9ON_000310, partial [Limisphaerales bacterium]
MLEFDRVSLDNETQSLRAEVRAFLKDNEQHFETPNSDFSTGHDAEFSQKLAQS